MRMPLVISTTSPQEQVSMLRVAMLVADEADLFHPGLSALRHPSSGLLGAGAELEDLEKALRDMNATSLQPVDVVERYFPGSSDDVVESLNQLANSAVRADFSADPGYLDSLLETFGYSKTQPARDIQCVVDEVIYEYEWAYMVALLSELKRRESPNLVINAAAEQLRRQYGEQLLSSLGKEGINPTVRALSVPNDPVSQALSTSHHFLVAMLPNLVEIPTSEVFRWRTETSSQRRLLNDAVAELTVGAPTWAEDSTPYIEVGAAHMQVKFEDYLSALTEASNGTVLKDMKLEILLALGITPILLLGAQTLGQAIAISTAAGLEVAIRGNHTQAKRNEAVATFPHRGAFHWVYQLQQVARDQACGDEDLKLS